VVKESSKDVILNIWCPRWHERACGKSIDVTWPRKVKSSPQCLCCPLSRQWLEIETRLQWSM